MIMLLIIDLSREKRTQKVMILSAISSCVFQKKLSNHGNKYLSRVVSQ